MWEWNDQAWKATPRTPAGLGAGGEGELSVPSDLNPRQKLL